MPRFVLPLLLSSCCLFAQREAGSLTTYSPHVVPLVILGEGWNQRIVLTNVDDSESAVGTISFYTRDGEPWSVALKERGSADTFVVNLPVGQTAIYETLVSEAPQQLGWALVSLATQSNGDLFGQTIFRKQTPDRPDLMTSMILGDRAFDRMTVFFDNTNGNYTGMGILTSELCSSSFCSEGEMLKVTIRDLSGVVISQKTITQKYGVLYWMNLGVDFPETNGRAGMFTVEPAEPFGVYLTGFSLQFAGNGAFTAVTPFED